MCLKSHHSSKPSECTYPNTCSRPKSDSTSTHCSSPAYSRSNRDSTSAECVYPAAGKPRAGPHNTFCEDPDTADAVFNPLCRLWLRNAATSTGTVQHSATQKLWLLLVRMGHGIPFLSLHMLAACGLCLVADLTHVWFFFLGFFLGGFFFRGG